MRVKDNHNIGVIYSIAIIDQNFCLKLVKLAEKPLQKHSIGQELENCHDLNCEYEIKRKYWSNKSWPIRGLTD